MPQSVASPQQMPRAELQELREDETLVDGLVIATLACACRAPGPAVAVLVLRTALGSTPWGIRMSVLRCLRTADTWFSTGAGMRSRPGDRDDGQRSPNAHSAAGCTAAACSLRSESYLRGVDVGVVKICLWDAHQLNQKTRRWVASPQVSSAPPPGPPSPMEGTPTVVPPQAVSTRSRLNSRHLNMERRCPGRWDVGRHARCRGST